MEHKRIVQDITVKSEKYEYYCSKKKGLLSSLVAVKHWVTLQIEQIQTIKFDSIECAMPLPVTTCRCVCVRV